MSGNNNNIAFVILGLFGFLVLLILSSQFIIDNQQNNQHCDEHSCHQQTIPQKNLQPQPPELQQPPEYYVNPNSHYHSRLEFWTI